MRVKHILNRLSVGERLKIVYERITLTRYTTAFIFVALVHCLVQIALQSTAFVCNSRASDTISQIVSDSDIPRQYAFVNDDQLLVCNGNPSGDDEHFDSVCWAFAGPGVALPNMTETTSSTSTTNSTVKLASDREVVSSPTTNVRIHYGLAYSTKNTALKRITSRDLSVVPTIGGGGDVEGVNITGLNDEVPSEVIELSARCVKALNWPLIVLRDAQREDISFLFFQVWLLGISLVTILNESIPHLIAGLVTHGMSTVWSAYQFSRTGRNENLYRRLIVDDTCDGIDVIPHFWDERMNYFTPILALNAIVLAVSMGLSLKLYSVYVRQTFKRVGASKQMNVLYFYVLLFSVFLQLSAFLTICGSALWIDVLTNGVLEGKTAYRVIFTIAGVLELPWVIVGWISIRREHRIWSCIFIVVGLVLCAAWTSMFASELYKWAFQTFPFFATLSITAFVVLVITVVLAVICRLHFGKGLPQYLKTEETFDDSSFVPVLVSNKRQSNHISVVFPDKRISAGRKDFNEGKSFNLNLYRRDSDKSRPPSVIDIKAPMEIEEKESFVELNSNSSSNAVGVTALDSLLARARKSWMSNRSRASRGKTSSRFSVFTSSSVATSANGDLERGETTPVPDVPVIPSLAKMPPAYARDAVGYSTRYPARRISDASSETSSSSEGSVRTITPARTGLPAINVVPSSVPRAANLRIGSPPRVGGLPGNPRAYRM